jgi:hypothetical protein
MPSALGLGGSGQKDVMNVAAAGQAQMVEGASVVIRSRRRDPDRSPGDLDVSDLTKG